MLPNFDIILEKVAPKWHIALISRYKRPGRDYKRAIADRLLMLLLNYRSYVTQVFVGYMFGMDASRVCRILKKLEPILASIMVLQKCKKLSQEEVENLIIDATEQPIERPKRRQKLYYSGQKKRHTLKTEIRTMLWRGASFTSPNRTQGRSRILRFLRAKSRRRRKADFSLILGIKVSLTSIKTPIFLTKPPKIGPWTPRKRRIMRPFLACA